MPQTTPALGPTTRLGQDQTPAYTLPAGAAPAPAPAPVPVVPASPAVSGHSKEAIGAIFLIGLGILFLFDSFFPGILVLIGLVAYLSESGRGRQQNGLRGLIFFAGLAVLFWGGFFFPGILILLGLMALFNRRLSFC